MLIRMPLQSGRAETANRIVIRYLNQVLYDLTWRSVFIFTFEILGNIIKKTFLDNNIILKCLDTRTKEKITYAVLTSSIFKGPVIGRPSIVLSEDEPGKLVSL